MVRALIAATAAGLMLVAGCGPRPAEHARSAPTSAKPSATTSAPAYLAEPKVGECHDLSLKAIAAASDTKKPVPCTAKHTTQTVAVVTAPPEAGKGSQDARGFAVGAACGDGFKKVVGGDSKTRAKSLYSLAWFMPTKAQRARGAKWMRCDVTLSDERHAYPLSGKVPLLDDGAKKGEIRCGRLRPGSGTWEFVPCTTRHQFKPDKLIEAEPGTTWKQARKAATKACLAEGGLATWSLPEQWGIGDRWYVCWSTVGRQKNPNAVT
ncbi:MAG TPA: septum formation family protein [Aeromicrobium sp.]|nr:septum formation family protein [Aeromicrobium sp.]